jgi:hypothetical protein
VPQHHLGGVVLLPSLGRLKQEEELLVVEQEEGR